MFLVKVLSNFMRILLFLVFLFKGFGSTQDQHIISTAGHKVETEKSLARATNNFKEETGESERKLLVERNPFVYRTELLNESMEKIQLVDNGAVTKSAYIPIIPKEPSLNSTDFRRELSDNEDSVLKNDSLMEPIISSRSVKENIVIKNGKKYRIVKVKKTQKSFSNDQSTGQMQRRTFKTLPNLLSILPLRWMTRKKKNETESQTRSENGTQWSKLSAVESSKEIIKHGIHNSEKIKKLLSLFTIVKFKNGECYTDGIKGMCIHQVECQTRGGKFSVTCADDLGVCCYFERTCGEVSNDNCTYFINEGYPQSSTTAPKVCTLTVEKATPDVKQLRLDFQIFQLREPTNGTCLQDRLVISGQDMNDAVPEICGANTGQHIYVDVENSSGPFNLNIITMGEYFPRSFRIKVTQMRREDELFAPKNCLQYYTEPTGYIQTFNYQQNINENLEEIDNGYFNNLNYVICIQKQKGFCSISYENEEFEARHPTFQLINVDEVGEKLLPPRQAGAETFDCPNDYVTLGGIRLCGEKLNDASIDIDYTRNFPVTDTTNGPFIVSVRTDATVSGRGFSLKFVQHPCPT